MNRKDGKKENMYSRQGTTPPNTKYQSNSILESINTIPSTNENRKGMNALVSLIMNNQ